MSAPAKKTVTPIGDDQEMLERWAAGVPDRITRCQERGLEFAKRFARATGEMALEVDTNNLDAEKPLSQLACTLITFADYLESVEDLVSDMRWAAEQVGGGGG